MALARARSSKHRGPHADQRRRITIYGKDTHSSHTNVGYVPQQSAIDWTFPASVFDVVMMGRSRHIGWFRWPGKRDREIVRDVLAHLSLDHLARDKSAN